jgi:TonB family protein
LKNLRLLTALVLFVPALVLSQANPTGSISGTIRSIAGARVPEGVVVVAVSTSESGSIINGISSSWACAFTDKKGNYQIKQLRLGEYYVYAFLNDPTFYPGRADSNAAVKVMVAAKGNVPKIDFPIVVPSNPIFPQRMSVSAKFTPSYPSLAKAARVEGLVVLQISVGRNGEPKDVRIARGHALLSETSIDAAKKTVFNALKVKGEAVEYITMLQMNYRFTR